MVLGASKGTRSSSTSFQRASIRSTTLEGHTLDSSLPGHVYKQKVFALENWSPGKINLFESLHNKEPLNYLNVGTGKDISIKELAEKIAKKFNYSGKIIWDKSKPDGTPRKLLDVSRINSLGWEAKIDLDKGLENTIQNFKENYPKGNLRL